MEQKIKRKKREVLVSTSQSSDHEWWTLPNFKIHLSQNGVLWDCNIDDLNDDDIAGFGVGPTKRDAFENARTMLNNEKWKKGLKE